MYACDVQLFTASATFLSATLVPHANPTRHPNTEHQLAEGESELGTKVTIAITITINPCPDNPTHIGSPVNAPNTPQHRRSASSSEKGRVPHHPCS
eukprot:2908627-Prymnesium_polylepis.2